MDYWILVLAFLAGLAIGIRPTPTANANTRRDGISYLTSVRTIIPLPSLIVYNQKSGGAALNAPLSNRSKSFDEQDSSPAFVRLSIVRLDSRPPALQKHASLTKKRSVTLPPPHRPMADSQPQDNREKKYQKQHEKWKLL